MENIEPTHADNDGLAGSSEAPAQVRERRLTDVSNTWAPLNTGLSCTPTSLLRLSLPISDVRNVEPETQRVVLITR